MRKLSVLILFLIGVTLLGCGNNDKKTAEMQSRAEGLFEDGKYEEAALVYENIYLNYPESEPGKSAIEERSKCLAMNNLKKAQELANTGRQDEVTSLLLEVAAVYPEDVAVNYGIGWTYFKMAEYVMDQAMQYPPAFQAQIMVKAGAYMDLAEVRFNKCVEIDKEDFHGYKGLTVFHFTQGENEEALENVNKAIECAEKDSDIIELRSLRMQIYMQDKETDKAKGEIDSLAEDYPDNGEIYYIIAQYYISKDKPDNDKAIETLKSGIKKDFEDVSVQAQMYALLSLLLNDKKEYSDARDMMLKALEIDPVNPDYLNTYPVVFTDYKIEEMKNEGKEDKKEEEGKE